MFKRIAAIGVILLLSGCAGMSKDECLYADWRAIGYEDGAAGRPVSAVSNRRAVCARKAGVTVDMASYTAGRSQGLELYCQPSRAFAVGSGGGTYYGVCAGPDEAGFITAYQSGRQLFVLEQAVAGIANEIRRAHADLNNVEHRIADAQAGLIAPKVPPEERIQYLADLKAFSEEKGNIETALIALNRDHVRAEEDLRDYQDHLAFNEPYPAAARPISARY